MTQAHFIAAYGTLRKGNYNFKRFNGLKYLKTVKIKGYELWDFGPYPYVVKKEDSEITVDILEAEGGTKRLIDSMELGAGYKMENITIEKKECTIYYMEKIYNNTTKIESGDYGNNHS